MQIVLLLSLIAALSIAVLQCDGAKGTLRGLLADKEIELVGQLKQTVQELVRVAGLSKDAGIDTGTGTETDTGTGTDTANETDTGKGKGNETDTGTGKGNETDTGKGNEKEDTFGDLLPGKMETTVKPLNVKPIEDKTPPPNTSTKPVEVESTTTAAPVEVTTEEKTKEAKKDEAAVDTFSDLLPGKMKTTVKPTKVIVEEDQTVSPPVNQPIEEKKFFFSPFGAY